VKKKAGQAPRSLASNRKASRTYHILERFEAGIELRGSEVKSIRAGNANLTGGFAAVEDGELFLREVHIAPYEKANRFNHEPTRPRRLLMHRREIDRLLGQVTRKGCTVIPLNLYLKRGRVKVELGLCRGKQTQDRREELRTRAAEREARQAARRG
jgi:SsrA-binding protein